MLLPIIECSGDQLQFAGSDESVESEKEPEEEKAESVILPPLTQPKKVELVGLTIVREYIIVLLIRNDFFL